MTPALSAKPMKDSGIEWVGEVPVHWGVRPFYSFVTEVARQNVGLKERNLLSLSYGRLVRKDMDRLGGLTPASFEGYNILEANDIVFRLTDLQNDQTSLRSARAQERGIITSAYVTVRPDGNPAFFEYLMRSYDTSKVFYGIGGGIRQSMKFADLKRLPVVVPPDDEMAAIASHLDRATTNIDALVAKKIRFIELLREKRQATITYAVTKGLDPSAPMKDSGLEWFGDIPTEWKLTPFRLAAWFQEGPGIMAADFKDAGIPLLRVAGVHGDLATTDGCNYLDPAKVAKRWKHFMTELGDLLISASATTGTISEVGEETVGCVAYTGIIRLKASSLTTKEFLKSFLGSLPFFEQINQFKAGSTIQHFGPTHLSQMRVALPPIAEQVAIVEHLDRATARIDTLIARTERSIELLREHRTALITAAVTGKIDLRSAT